jgi:hypothetical protein
MVFFCCSNFPICVSFGFAQFIEGKVPFLEHSGLQLIVFVMRVAFLWLLLSLLPLIAQSQSIALLKVTHPFKELFASSIAEFSAKIPSKASVYSRMVLSDPLLGCGELNNANEMTGHHLLVQRGNCTFSEKATNALKAGLWFLLGPFQIFFFVC